MKKLIAGFLMTVVLATGLYSDAEAKRLGGGRSVGTQRSDVVKRDTVANPSASQTAPQAAPSPAQAASAGPAAQPARSGLGRWMGPLAGLAAGIGLAALLSHFGLGEGFANVLLVMLAVATAFMLFRFLRRRAAPQASDPMAYAGAYPAQMPTAPSPSARIATPGGGSSSDAREGFDEKAFLHQAKVNFVRLQAANDAGNLNDLREFTSPEVYAELSLAIKERGAQVQQTDVVTLDARVVDVSEASGQYVVSVRFAGMIRESADQPAQPFDEVWHLVKPVSGASGWLISGIEQIA